MRFREPFQLVHQILLVLLLLRPAEVASIRELEPIIPRCHASLGWSEPFVLDTRPILNDDDNKRPPEPWPTDHWNAWLKA